MRIRTERVHFMPRELTSGVLYVSEEFGIAVHLCACGCGSKIRTPLGPTEWKFEEAEHGPTLYPSVGNWQQNCKSHYWIRDGQVLWGEAWTQEQIKAGRTAEAMRRKAYYDAMYARPEGLLQILWRWVRRLFGR